MWWAGHMCSPDLQNGEEPKSLEIEASRASRAAERRAAVRRPGAVSAGSAHKPAQTALKGSPRFLCAVQDRTCQPCMRRAWLELFSFSLRVASLVSGDLYVV